MSYGGVQGPGRDDEREREKNHMWKALSDTVWVSHFPLTLI